MNLDDISLSIYSFGYAAGFIRDERPEAAAPTIGILNLPDVATRHGLGGIEFPIDRYFSLSALEQAEAFIAGVRRRGLRVAIDLEQFDPSYILATLPVLARQELGFARIKMATWYGGNRYLEPSFGQQVRAFTAGLQVLEPQLRAHRVRLLIENHQDLGADDLLRIIAEISSEWIGVNWDIGNSLAVLDTPESFLRKAAQFIGNVHLKDYRVVQRQTGFALCRCALGDGVVDFAGVLADLARQHGVVPMTIELGAQLARQADVFTKAYWQAYPPCPTSEMAEFFGFIARHARSADGGESAWERRLSGQAIIDSEMKELERSVTFLRRLELDRQPALA